MIDKRVQSLSKEKQSQHTDFCSFCYELKIDISNTSTGVSDS